MTSRTCTIGEICAEFGIPLRTARFYHLGFTLSEFRSMLAAVRDDPADLPLSREQITAQIEHLESQRAEIETAIATLRGRMAA